METHKISHIDNIKSQLIYAAACERQMGQWLLGNQPVDFLAQEAATRASVATAEADSYSRQLRWAEQYLRDIASSLLQWKGVTSTSHGPHPNTRHSLLTNTNGVKRSSPGYAPHVGNGGDRTKDTS
jgi:hypothetical protein